VSMLERSAVGPSHYEVTVETKSCGIAICKSKFVICEGASIKEELVENGKEGNRVRFWAHTTIVITNCRVSHMTFVIRSVKVNPVPARWEVHLGSHFVAMSSRKTWSLFLANRNAIFISQAHHMNGSLRRIAVVLSSSQRVTGNHPEVIGKGHRYFGRSLSGRVVAFLETWSVVASPELIINRVVSERYHLPHFVRGSVVVHLRNPVIAVVDSLVAGGFVGMVGIHRSHHALEIVTSNDAVYVLGGNARLDDGV